MLVETVCIFVFIGVSVWGLDRFMNLGLFKKEVKNARFVVDRNIQDSVMKNKFGQIKATNQNTFSKRNGYKQKRSAWLTVRKKEVNEPHQVITNFLNKLQSESKNEQ